MMDWLEDWFPGFCLVMIAIMLIGIVLLIIGAYQGIMYDRELMQKCMDDGRKEYECRSMIHGRNNNTPMPVPIIVPMGR